MPPRKLLSEIPPPADSSSEEEEKEETDSEESEEEEESDRLVDGQNGDAEKQEESDDDDDGNVQDEKKSPLLKKPTIPANSAMSDPGLDSESTQPSPSLSAFTIKLQKPSTKPNKVGSKRSTESKESVLPSKKKSKATRGGGYDEEPKKGSAIQRLWSEGDELAILDGLIKYKAEKAVDPYADMVAFHEFIKESLHVDVSKSQLTDKIRRLKKKYRTNIERGENGQDPVFSKTHDLKSFELSKKVWGGKERNNDKNEIKRNGKIENVDNGGGGASVTLGLPSLRTGRKKMQAQVSSVEEVKNVEEGGRAKGKEEVKTVEKHQSKSDGKREDEGDNVENLGEKYPFLGDSLNTEALSEGVKLILGEKLGMLQKGKLEELENKWKCLKQAELELFVQRMKLVNEQVMLALDSIKS
ncbi:STOREKEEPER protein-like [Euphorbia lathyris]|uniref:STOREKEEPER protein-like n=1 Tax=Euphorbia lathyris TaxID=212925 RepID=UPI0033136ED6